MAKFLLGTIVSTPGALSAFTPTFMSDPSPQERPMCMTHCQCCLRITSTKCSLCGWIQDPALNERGYSKLNRQTVSKARIAFTQSFSELLRGNLRYYSEHRPRLVTLSQAWLGLPDRDAPMLA